MPCPEQNLALDEALLDWADRHDGPECLRFWRSSIPFVVLGYSDRVAREINVSACQQAQCPILRRCSGGGTVLQGPHSFNYALVLHIQGELTSLTQTNRYVLERHRRALTALTQQPIELRGSTDLAIDGLKFSGNSQRRKRRALLFHGTILLGLDLDLLNRFLPMPSRQPDYRQNRSHGEFLTSLPVSPAKVKETLVKAWDVTHTLPTTPDQATAQLERLVHSQYGNPAWIYSR